MAEAIGRGLLPWIVRTKEPPMTEDILPRPEGGEKAIETAIEHIHTAEHDLAQARTDESRAEHELDVAVHELEHAEHEKDFWVIVNGQRKEVHTARLTFDEIIALAFCPVPQGEDVQFSVQYTRGRGGRPSGTLVEGQSVAVKDGMEFDVTQTNRS
jgi:multiubiquitin